MFTPLDVLLIIAGLVVAALGLLLIVLPDEFASLEDEDDA